MDNSIVKKDSQSPTLAKKLTAWIIENIVMIIFTVICIAGIVIADQKAFFLVSQLLERI